MVIISEDPKSKVKEGNVQSASNKDIDLTVKLTVENGGLNDNPLQIDHNGQSLFGIDSWPIKKDNAHYIEYNFFIKFFQAHGYTYTSNELNNEENKKEIHNQIIKSFNNGLKLTQTDPKNNSYSSTIIIDGTSKTANINYPILKVKNWVPMTEEIIRTSQKYHKLKNQNIFTDGLLGTQTIQLTYPKGPTFEQPYYCVPDALVSKYGSNTKVWPDKCSQPHHTALLGIPTNLNPFKGYSGGIWGNKRFVINVDNKIYLREQLNPNDGGEIENIPGVVLYDKEKHGDLVYVSDNIKSKWNLLGQSSNVNDINAATQNQSTAARIRSSTSTNAIN